MNLTPREKDKLLVAMAAVVARRRLERGVTEERPDRRESDVAAAHSVSAFVFQIIKERGHERSVQVRERQSRRCTPESLLGERQQQTKRIPIGCDCMRARTSLGEQAFREKAFQQ